MFLCSHWAAQPRFGLVWEYPRPRPRWFATTDSTLESESELRQHFTLTVDTDTSSTDPPGTDGWRHITSPVSSRQYCRICRYRYHCRLLSRPGSKATGLSRDTGCEDVERHFLVISENEFPVTWWRSVTKLACPKFCDILWHLENSVTECDKVVSKNPECQESSWWCKNCHFKSWFQAQEEKEDVNLPGGFPNLQLPLLRPQVL